MKTLCEFYFLFFSEWLFLSICQAWRVFCLLRSPNFSKEGSVTAPPNAHSDIPVDFFFSFFLLLFLAACELVERYQVLYEVKKKNKPYRSLLMSFVLKKKTTYTLLWTNSRWGLNYGSRLPPSMIILTGIDCLLELEDRRGFWLSHEAKEGLD